MRDQQSRCCALPQPTPLRGGERPPAPHRTQHPGPRRALRQATLLSLSLPGRCSIPFSELHPRAVRMLGRSTPPPAGLLRPGASAPRPGTPRPGPPGSPHSSRTGRCRRQQPGASIPARLGGGGTEAAWGDRSAAAAPRRAAPCHAAAASPGRRRGRARGGWGRGAASPPPGGCRQRGGRLQGRAGLGCTEGMLRVEAGRGSPVCV